MTKDTDINTARSYDGRTALCLSALYGSDDCMSLLLKHPNININVRDNDGRTALMWATKKRREVHVKILLQQRGLNLNIIDKDGNSAVILAAMEFENESIEKMLLEMPEVDLNIVNTAGRKVEQERAQRIRKQDEEKRQKAQEEARKVELRRTCPVEIAHSGHFKPIEEYSGSIDGFYVHHYEWSCCGAHGNIMLDSTDDDPKHNNPCSYTCCRSAVKSGHSYSCHWSPFV